MKTKKHSKQIRIKIIQKYQSGEGYKNISKVLNISRSTVRAIIQKWKAYSSAVNLPRADCYQKLGVNAKKLPVKETTTKSVGTAEEIQRKDRNTFHSQSDLTELEFNKAGQTQTAVSRCGKLTQTCPLILTAVIAANGTSTEY